MTIATAVLNGKTVVLYDRQGRRIGQIPVHGRQRILGYAGETVSVLSGPMVHVYDDQAKLLYTVYRGVVSQQGSSGLSASDDWETPV